MGSGEFPIVCWESSEKDSGKWRRGGTEGGRKAVVGFLKTDGIGNTHLLGTVLVTLGEGGVGRRAGLSAGAELDRAVVELAVKDAHVVVGVRAVVRHCHREAVRGNLCFDRRVVWHGRNGDCDRGV